MYECFGAFMANKMFIFYKIYLKEEKKKKKKKKTNFNIYNYIKYNNNSLQFYAKINKNIDLYSCVSQDILER